MKHYFYFSVPGKNNSLRKGNAAKFLHNSLIMESLRNLFTALLLHFSLFFRYSVHFHLIQNQFMIRKFSSNSFVFLFGLVQLSGTGLYD